MEHVLHLIDAALGGELGAAEREALDAHLAACPTCAAAWRGRRAAWDRLDVLAAPVAAAAAESRVWPAVRVRTFGGEREALLFGAGRWRKTGWAVAALAAGLALGVLLPGGGGSEARAGTGGGGSFWVEADATADAGFSALWLAAGTGEDGS